MCMYVLQMAAKEMNSSSVKKTNDDDDEQWEAAETMEHLHHQWSQSSDEDDKIDNQHEFFDAHDTEFDHSKTEHKTEKSPSASADTTADLLHDRLNRQTSVHEEKTIKSPEDPYYIDEELLIEREALLTAADKEKRYAESKTSKDEGNDSFGRGDYDQALKKYSDALCLCPMEHRRDRAIIYSNRAACLMKLDKHEAAVQSCSKAIELDPTYVKPLIRRAESYKHIDKLEDALQDYQRIVELDPNNIQARREIHILPDQIKERNEKLKEEMLGKLKELGNMVLKPFGLSTANFKMQQDPGTGSYSVSFNK